MDFFLKEPSSLRLLVLADVDINSTTLLSEKFIPLSPQFDGILVVGPLGGGVTNTDEERAVVLGDISSVLAQLENLVCRVSYLPTEQDPAKILVEQTHLTPNSINIHGRRLNLLQNLFLMGFAERGDKAVVDMQRKEAEFDHAEDLSNVEICSGLSIEIMEEMLKRRVEKSGEDSDVVSSSTDSGVFMLHYRYSHTLNHFLFHMNTALETCGINMCIISSTACSEELSRLPKMFGKLHIIAPKSLRSGGHYTVVDLAQHGDSQRWVCSRSETYTL